MPRIFVSQQRMQQWTEDGKVSVQDDTMLLPSLGKAFRLTEAVHIVRVVSDGVDSHRLVGRVKTRAQLAKMRAEVYHSSILLGEVAYECELGFVGEVLGKNETSSGLHRLAQ